jgi:zinc/manganese transport system permease protein
MAFLMLVVLNLVSGFQALGTLMAVGLMMLPAITARLWSETVEGMLVMAVSVAFGSGLAGLLLSYHFELPSGPAIILVAGFTTCFRCCSLRRAVPCRAISGRGILNPEEMA